MTGAGGRLPDEEPVGWWPDSHPDMRSFLGVPIAGGKAVVGAFYLTDKLGAGAFAAEDQEIIELFAAPASRSRTPGCTSAAESCR